MSQTNPFASFPVATPKPVETAPLGPFRFEYLRAYNYIFENPNWLNTVLLWSVCILAAGFIPVLPYVVMVGHLFEIVESLIRTRGTRYPDFDFNRFSEYLMRGLWPVLIGLLVFFPMLVLAYVGFGGAVMLGIAAGSASGEEIGPIVGVAVGLFAFLLLIAFFLGVGLLLTPMILRAGLQQEFGAAFDFGWAIDFIKRTWFELILSTFFMQLSGVVLQLVGALILCVGAYPAGAIVAMAHAFMLYQLYTLYLSRGGTPIPLKPQMPLAPAGYMPPPPGYPPPQY